MNEAKQTTCKRCGRKLRTEEVLRENDFDLYIYKDDKVYIKNKQGVKRIKRVKRSQ